MVLVELNSITNSRQSAVNYNPPPICGLGGFGSTGAGGALNAGSQTVNRHGTVGYLRWRRGDLGGNPGGAGGGASLGGQLREATQQSSHKPT